jgi:hypothetical protein
MPILIIKAIDLARHGVLGLIIISSSTMNGIQRHLLLTPIVFIFSESSSHHHAQVSFFLRHVSYLRRIFGRSTRGDQTMLPDGSDDSSCYSSASDGDDGGCCSSASDEEDEEYVLFRGDSCIIFM